MSLHRCDAFRTSASAVNDRGRLEVGGGGRTSGEEVVEAEIPPLVRTTPGHRT